MEETNPSCVKSNFPIILVAAVARGVGLYFLHEAIQVHVWSANRLAWVTALYAAVVFGPLSIQLLARYVRLPVMWGWVGFITLSFFYFGWHEGATRLLRGGEFRSPFEDFFTFGMPLTVLWLLLMPFVQGRLEGGRWRIAYSGLFANAWRNELVLAEAALFTGLFWLLLELWQTLFTMLKIGFFQQLFDEPLFVYPVTALTFGIALHLIGSIDRLTSVVLEQLLNVLKWLAIVAGILLLLFTVALVFRLPALVLAGEHAIGATWLLWLVAVLVLLLNAAFRDGSVETPYPKMIARALRFTVPLLLIVSITATYALAIRVHQHGITVQRVWGFVVAVILFLYAGGYSIAAFSRAPWMAGIARVNVWVAIVLMVVITLTLTPALPPERLAATSQFELILARQTAAPRYDESSENTPFSYLRFDSGTYGLARLKQLSVVSHGAGADRIRRLAAAELAGDWKGAAWLEEHLVRLRDILSKLPVYPAGRTLDPDLLDALVAYERNNREMAAVDGSTANNCAGVFVDLDGDGVEEFELVHIWGGWVFEHRATGWQFAARSARPTGNLDWSEIRTALEKGDFSSQPARWKQLVIGDRSFRTAD